MPQQRASNKKYISAYLEEEVIAPFDNPRGRGFRDKTEMLREVILLGLEALNSGGYNRLTPLRPVPPAPQPARRGLEGGRKPLEVANDLALEVVRQTRRKKK